MPFSRSEAAAGASSIDDESSRSEAVGGGHGRRRRGRVGVEIEVEIDERRVRRARAEPVLPRALQHEADVGAERVVVVQRLRPVERRAGVVAQLRGGGGDLVVRVVHAVRRMAGRRAPLRPRAAEPLIARAVLLLRELVRAGLELHRAEHAAIVRHEHARVGAVTRLDRADRREQRPRHAGDRAPRLVERQVRASGSPALPSCRRAPSCAVPTVTRPTRNTMMMALRIGLRYRRDRPNPQGPLQGGTGRRSGECLRLGFSKQ